MTVFKGTATVLIGNEILAEAAKKVFRDEGFEVRTDVDSAARSDFAVVGSYFLLLGIVNQLRSIHPSMPIVLLHDASHELELNGDRKNFFGVIELEGNSGMEAREKIARWFTEGRGSLLTKKGVRK